MDGFCQCHGLGGKHCQRFPPTVFKDPHPRCNTCRYNIHLTLKSYDRFFPKLPLRVTQQTGNKDIKSLNAHNSVTIGPTELADPSLESSFHALSDGQCVVSG